ncbi:response regulator [Idiomarina sp. HP20-50]|uniref:response regulator n=1 Tax=Idiomarina sp. HP20-50 TaxID=3070813 RepID=UPI00294B4CF1|nr:response regulator [Idiomarina sp. HP20-50]MDV6316925.1 response regulator [Idiomarina sp. HP20-50]
MPRAHITLIEDDPVFQSVVNQFLVNSGYDVQCASNGGQGIDICRRERPDIVLCDLKLPDIDGLQVIEKLLKVCTSTPIIVISASEKMSDIREAVRLGAWDYLVKPIQSLNVIENAIEHCLKRYQLEETYLHDVWELDAHLDLLYQDDVIVGRLVEELLPEGALSLNDYHFGCRVTDFGQAPVWVDYRPLTQGKVLVVMAVAQNATEQNLLPLLVLKTLIDPLIRQYLSGHDNTLLSPAALLSHLNHELCHSQVRTAFDTLVGVVDTKEHSWLWAQAGDKFQPEPGAKPDLALGIWQHANFREHKIEHLHRFYCAFQGTELSVTAAPQTA